MMMDFPIGPPPEEPQQRKAPRYATRACDFCKQRHLRCDGETVCVQCAKRKQPCCYTQKNVKRGPKPKGKRPRSDSLPTPTRTSKSYDEWSEPYEPEEDIQFQPQTHQARPQNVFQSSELALLALSAFEERITPIYPNNFRLSSHIASDVWRQLSTLVQWALDDVPDALTYCVVFAHGCRIIGQEGQAQDFASKAEEFTRCSFFSPQKMRPELMFHCADQLVACLTLLGLFKIESDDFTSARVYFTQAYNILNMHINEVSPPVSHRLYAHLAGMSRSTSDMSHWVSNAHLLGASANTLVNRIFLSMLYCSPSMLRDPRNKPIPGGLHIPASQGHLKQRDLLLYQHMLRELDETEEILWANESADKKPGVFADYLLSYRLVLQGCRGLVLAQCGYAEEAAVCAKQSIDSCKALQTRVVYSAIPLALSYAVQVVKALGNFPLFQEAMPLLEIYQGFYPFVAQILVALRPPIASHPFPQQMDLRSSQQNQQIPRQIGHLSKLEDSEPPGFSMFQGYQRGEVFFSPNDDGPSSPPGQGLIPLSLKQESDDMSFAQDHATNTL